jgi:hypothetical protein
MLLEVSDREFATLLALCALAQQPDSDLRNYPEFFAKQKPLTDPQITNGARMRTGQD